VTTVVTYAQLPNCAGLDLGMSPVRYLPQADIQAFADLTHDHLWIHVDPVAAAAGPFGAPIAHGLLTLSLTATFWIDLFHVSDARLSLNYGFDRVRFAAPVRVGRGIRMSATIATVTAVDGGYQLGVDQRILVEGEPKPAVAAHSLYRFYGDAGAETPVGEVSA